MKRMLYWSKENKTLLSINLILSVRKTFASSMLSCFFCFVLFWGFFVVVVVVVFQVSFFQKVKNFVTHM